MDKQRAYFGTSKLRYRAEKPGKKARRLKKITVKHLYRDESKCINGDSSREDNLACIKQENG